MRRVRPLPLLGAWALLIAWLGGDQLACALSEQNRIAPLPETERAVLVLPGDSRLFRLFFDGRLCPLEQRLFADAADARLDEHTLLDAALIASGVQQDDDLRHYQRRLDSLVDELRRSGQLGGPPRRRAQAIFEFMHRRILHAGYRIDCTDLRKAIDQGCYNCVSASVLFNCLAERFGLRVCGLETPGHALSRLIFPDGPLDVETTCPRWFRLIGDPEKQAQLVEETLGRRAGDDRAQSRQLTAREMAAMVYYNRGVDLLAHKRFDQAAVANAKALRLDPSSTTARGNLLATVNNWAIALGSAECYAEAVDLLREGLAFDPHYETFALNYLHVHHQWVEHLCGAGKFGPALKLVARAAADLPDRPYFQRAAVDVYRQWGQSLLRAGLPTEASRPAKEGAQSRRTVLGSLFSVFGLRRLGPLSGIDGTRLLGPFHLTIRIP